MFTGASQDMSLTQIYCISAERWGAWTLSPHWRRCPNKPEGYSIREERLRTQTKKPTFNYYIYSDKTHPKAKPFHAP
ncbi:hypothetical protein PCANC_08937 [Puccinia coronata f. sp. avenae]|uniref:Uncharacterized protein n=1 Tax=Puccinia coronata f. sp. avenae TaxID=200324 RepID=A0A2N5T2E9_9BASI|nr:hypothetical protein PCANC_08937 [Puccinia coronata f. sp. avenae]